MKKEEAAIVDSGEVTITVDGGYNPPAISIPQGKPTTIAFLRKDPSACLEEVVVPDFHIKKALPLNKEVSVTVTPQKPGTYSFSCGMGMVHGKIIVQ